MADLEDFKYVMALWKEMRLPDIIERDIRIDLDANKIVTIAGVRRAGKTSIMFQCMKDLAGRGIKKDNMAYVNFENERLIAAKATELDNLLIAHTQMFEPERGPIYLFLDEIQNVENWDKWVRKVYDTGRYRIAITGSSSQLLSREIATALAGRNLSYVVYPFSFGEFVRAKGIVADKATGYSAKKGLLLRALDEFLEYGSFPEVALADSPARKMELLSSYFDAIFFRDIVKRYDLREVGALEIFLKALSCNYASYFSSVKTHNYFGSLGFRISRNTVLNFLEYSRSVFFVEMLEQHLRSPRKRFASQMKSYAIDIGLSRLFAGIDKGRSLENAVFLELLRRRGVGGKVYYLRLKSGKEVDFILDGRRKELIQVAYRLDGDKTHDREIGALVEASSALGLRSCKVITYDYQKIESVHGLRIDCVPFWSWALE